MNDLSQILKAMTTEHVWLLDVSFDVVYSLLIGILLSLMAFVWLDSSEAGKMTMRRIQPSLFSLLFYVITNWFCVSFRRFDPRPELLAGAELLLYFSVFLLFCTIRLWIFSGLRERTAVSPGISRGLAGLLPIAAMLAIIGMTVSGVRTDLPYSIACCGMFLPLAIVVFLYRRYYGKNERVLLLLYLNIPTFCSLIPGIGYRTAAVTGVLCFNLMVLESSRVRIREYNMKIAEQKHREGLRISQTRPHFLYNCISTISALCDEDPATAQKALKVFSSYLRRNLEAIGLESLIPFSRELEYTDNYLYLERLRFGKKLKVETDIRETDFFIPSFTVQPLVENAVKHGICGKKGGGTVRIRSERSGEQILITVRNDGAVLHVASIDEIPQKEDGRSHMGLKMIRERLQSIPGAGIEFRSNEEEGTVVAIRLPVKEVTEL